VTNAWLIQAIRTRPAHFDDYTAEATMKTLSRYNPDAEFFIDEGCYIIELLNSPKDKDCSIARARVEPGTRTKLHCLRKTVERYVILEGEGQVEIGGAEARAVGPLDVIQIPPGESQRITNTGQRDLVFLAICTPRFKPDVYVKLEN
jgi:mannose-6-phosphate isomerase-like protein (cupin superfamily)